MYVILVNVYLHYQNIVNKKNGRKEIICKDIARSIRFFRNGFLRHCRHIKRLCRIGFWMVGNDGRPDTLSGVLVVFPARRSFWPDDEPHRAQKHSADVYGRHRCRYGDSVAAL